jgi:hypothetical protein
MYMGTNKTAHKKLPQEETLRALLAASLHGFPSLHFRENFKKVIKITPQQLPFPGT